MEYVDLDALIVFSSAYSTEAYIIDVALFALLNQQVCPVITRHVSFIKVLSFLISLVFVEFSRNSSRSFSVKLFAKLESLK